MHCIPSRIIPSSAVYPFHHECSHSSFITELQSDWNKSFSSSVQTLAMVSSAVASLTCSSRAFTLFFGLGPLDPFAGLLLVTFSKHDLPSHVGGEWRTHLLHPPGAVAPLVVEHQWYSLSFTVFTNGPSFGGFVVIHFVSPSSLRPRPLALRGLSYDLRGCPRPDL